MTPVRQLYVGNLRGNLDGTLATANSPRGAVYPAGSVTQLIPTEGYACHDGALQRTDPRCGNNPISPEDAEAIKELEQLLKAPR